MKQISKKLRLALIDRFFISANELPHELSFSHTEDGWKIFNAKSFNFSLQLGLKNNEVIRWS